MRKLTKRLEMAMKIPHLSGEESAPGKLPPDASLLLNDYHGIQNNVEEEFDKFSNLIPHSSSLGEIMGGLGNCSFAHKWNDLVANDLMEQISSSCVEQVRID